MPAIISFGEQQLIESLLSALTRAQSSNLKAVENQCNLADLYVQVVALCQKLGFEVLDPLLAAEHLSQIYQQQVLTEVAACENLHQLACILHRGPQSWGRIVAVYPVIFQAIMQQNEFFKERNYIVQMNVEERSQYINSAHLQHNDQFALWAQQLQSQVQSKIKQNAQSAPQVIGLPALLQQSLTYSNCLRHQQSLSDLEHSYVVELQQEVKCRLLHAYQILICNLPQLSAGAHLIKICENLADIKQQISVEYKNIHAYARSEHLITLESCKELLLHARKKLKPSLQSAQYTNVSVDVAASYTSVILASSLEPVSNLVRRFS